MAYDYKGMSFLIVDDFALIRDFLKHLVRSLGAKNVTVSDSGQDALSQLNMRAYDVILCDYYLGEGKDGQQVLEEARYRGLLPPTSVFIMVTMEQLLPQAMAVIEHRPDGYMVKPVVQDVLLHRLNQTLDRRRFLEQVYRAMRGDQFEEALTLCSELQEKEPRFFTDIQEIKTDLLIRLKRFDEAEQVLDLLLTKRSFPWALFDKGKVLYARGNYGAAAKCFLKLLKDNRHYLEAYDWLADCQHELGDLKRAQQTLALALQVSPKSAQRQKRLAQFALENGDPETAESALRLAIREGKYSCFVNYEVYWLLARIMADDGRIASALKMLAEAQKLFTRSPLDRVGIYVAQAVLYESRGEWTRARDIIKMAWRDYTPVRRELKPDVTLELVRILAVCKMTLDAEQAIEDLRYYHKDDQALQRRTDELAGRIDELAKG